MIPSPKTSAAALLPNGLRDGLPPDAEREAQTVAAVMAAFTANGYQRVKPPLIEFEDSLLAGAGRATAEQTFRVMDPISQRMMGLRADMTPQVARIAATRLVRMPRPLRLAYAGQVLRVRGTQLRPERQFTQAGIELIGADGDKAVAEVVLLTVEALERAGVGRVTVDLTFPPLVPAVCRGLGLDDATSARLRKGLEQKDLAGLEALDGAAAPTLAALARAVGPLDRALPALEALDLPPEADAARSTLAAVCRRVASRAPGVTITLDPLEHKGFEYHTGCSFALFAAGARGELGRGGAYDSALGATRERCCGATLYLDSVLDVAPAMTPPRRLLVPADLAIDRRRQFQDQGWVTVPSLEGEADAAEATRLGCDHWLTPAGLPQPLAS